ncbi:hypothetical protein NKDENANG_00658 [Candidatus Entotheonellaceae bacterium PAL068K]
MRTFVKVAKPRGLPAGSFDLRPGNPTAVVPPNPPMQVYTVRLVGDDILVDLST